ncbi:26s protease regulatory subunit 6a [Echinococcus multilocularis]|uniref:26s protease regulatory subunit 6a n=1 Tax=Echinococcus multilocularis TaxID=6211 RepID=A0A0S4MK21_ECHMU|nr:26s protease regulatory subunit 6a [Echinococcus multilocularis]
MGREGGNEEEDEGEGEDLAEEVVGEQEVEEEEEEDEDELEGTTIRTEDCHCDIARCVATSTGRWAAMYVVVQVYTHVRNPNVLRQAVSCLLLLIISVNHCLCTLVCEYTAFDFATSGSYSVLTNYTQVGSDFV